MQVILATKTIDMIDEAVKRDQGNRYRQILGSIIGSFTDAYRSEEDGFRSHLGASMLGRECSRELWYGFRWAEENIFDGRILRLFNRGHMEEPRFVALLMTIDVVVYQQDANGKQFRITEHGGHLGGSGDGVGVGIPDLPPGTPCLLEFKTHGSKSFAKLSGSGVRESKFEHYVQTCLYMKKMDLNFTLYLGVNKDTDELYGEIICRDDAVADQFLDRGGKIIFNRKAPPRLHGASPAFFKCRMCNKCDLCFNKKQFRPGCRTCTHVVVNPEGGWDCTLHGAKDLSREMQLRGCTSYQSLPNDAS